MPWQTVDSIIITNYQSYWKHPILNKYLQTKQNIAPSESYEGILILKKDKKNVFISHPFNSNQAKHTFGQITITTYTSKKQLKKILKQNCGKRIGFDARHTAVSTLSSLKKLTKAKFIDVSKKLEQAREIKDGEEIKKIKKAVKETKKTIIKTVFELKKGDTEKETYLKIKDEFEKRGMETGFCIVAFGKNTANIHHVPTNKKLEKEMPVMIDCGAKYKGYYADLTTSFWFGAKEPREYTNSKKKIEETLKKIEEKLKEGTKAKALWKETKQLGRLPHALGHGIGL